MSRRVFSRRWAIKASAAAVATLGAAQAVEPVLAPASAAAAALGAPAAGGETDALRARLNVAFGRISRGWAERPELQRLMVGVLEAVAEAWPEVESDAELLADVEARQLAVEARYQALRAQLVDELPAEQLDRVLNLAHNLAELTAWDAAARALAAPAYFRPEDVFIRTP
jgi:hypothetical protein